jgi:hypothetical protein
MQKYLHNAWLSTTKFATYNFVHAKNYGMWIKLKNGVLVGFQMHVLS